MGSFRPSRRALLSLVIAAVALVCLVLLQGSSDPAGADLDLALVAGDTRLVTGRVSVTR